MASTDALPIPRKNVAYRVVFPIFDADGDLVTGAAGLDSEVSKDQGTFADCTNEATEIATASGMYYLDLTSTEMNADNVTVIVKTSTSGAKTTPMVFYPLEDGDWRVNVVQFNGTAGTFASGRPEVNTTHVGGTSQTARDIGASVLLSSGTGTGQLSLSSGAVLLQATQTGVTIPTVTNLTNAPSSGDFTATMKTSIGTAVAASAVASVTGNVGGNVTGSVGSVTGNVGGNVTGSVASVSGNVGGNVTGSVGSVATGGITRASYAADTGQQTVRSNTAQAGGSTSITLDASASSVTDFYKNCLVVLTGGTGIGQGRFCTAYNGTTKVATVTAWGTNPDVTTTFAIIPFDAIVGATAPTAAQNATAVWTDLLAGSDFSTALSIGKLLKDNLDAAITSRMASYTQPTGFLAASFPASVASPTNITAGTITTVTNLTNAPTAGDFTATMKTSVGTAVAASAVASVTGNVGGNVTGSVGSVSGAVGSVTGNVGGNVVGSVASVTAGVTVTTNNDKTGYGLSAAAVQAVWDALTSALTTVGSIGKLLVDNINATITSRMATYTQPTGFLAATFPTTVASTTNITGGTITNLTNAPTAGDFTSTMKTSIGTAVAASAVASVTAGVTVTTNNDKTGYAVGTGGIAATSFASGALTAAAIAADAIGASELAQDAAQEIADEVLNRDLAGGGSGNSRNVRNALRALRNKVAVSGGTATIYQEDDASAAWTAAVTTTAGNPITTVDPA